MSVIDGITLAVLVCCIVYLYEIKEILIEIKKKLEIW